MSLSRRQLFAGAAAAAAAPALAALPAPVAPARGIPYPHTGAPQTGALWRLEINCDGRIAGLRLGCTGSTALLDIEVDEFTIGHA